MPVNLLPIVLWCHYNPFLDLIVLFQISHVVINQGMAKLSIPVVYTKMEVSRNPIIPRPTNSHKHIKIFGMLFFLSIYTHGFLVSFKYYSPSCYSCTSHLAGHASAAPVPVPSTACLQSVFSQKQVLRWLHMMADRCWAHFYYLADPRVCPLLHFYPEDSGQTIEEVTGMAGISLALQITTLRILPYDLSKIYWLLHIWGWNVTRWFHLPLHRHSLV